MCRPNYASLVFGERLTGYDPQVLTLYGEGSHAKIAEHWGHRVRLPIPVTLPYSTWYVPEDTDPAEVEMETRDLDIAAAIPFECIWSQGPHARFQPNGDKFYGYEELPTERDFREAQVKLDAEIGTLSALFQWLMKAAQIWETYSIFAPSEQEIQTQTRSAYTRGFPYNNPPHAYTIESELRKLTGMRLGPSWSSSEQMIEDYLVVARHGNIVPDGWRDRFDLK